MKKLIITLGIVCLFMTGCRTEHKLAPESSTITPTGYSSEEVQRLSLFYDGSLYLYNATGFDLPKEESWEVLGQVASVNNLEFPTEDFCGTHLNVGQEIYWEPSEPQKLYVKYDSGFALFESAVNNKESAEDASVAAKDLKAGSSKGNPSVVKMDYGTSSIYSKADMDAAIKIIMKEFEAFEGCELHSLSYTSDEESNTAENIAWMNQCKAKDDPEVFTQCIAFDSSFHSPKTDSGAWNPDEEYTDWYWWLARSDGGEWKLMTYGYA